MTVQTQPQATRDLRQAARQGLLPARGSGWLAGFNNMLAKELGEWFRTRRWLWQLLIWVIIIDGFVALPLFILPALASIWPALKPTAEGMFAGLPPEVWGVYAYFTILAFAGPIGVIILAQDEVIQEKQSGTAAWILSKPASRPAFILTKLLSNILGALVFIVGVPGLVAWVLRLPGSRCGGTPGAIPGRSWDIHAGADLLHQSGDPAGRPVRVTGPGAGHRLRSHARRH